MPQELHVIRCYNCEKFQVDIVKKVTKWSCKMCGEKQSLKQVFARGTGKECRLIVQELSMKYEATAKHTARSEENSSCYELEQEIQNGDNTNYSNKVNETVFSSNNTNKWDKYLETPIESVEKNVESANNLLKRKRPENSNLIHENKPRYKKGNSEVFHEESFDLVELNKPVYLSPYSKWTRFYETSEKVDNASKCKGIKRNIFEDQEELDNVIDLL